MCESSSDNVCAAPAASIIHRSRNALHIRARRRPLFQGDTALKPFLTRNRVGSHFVLIRLRSMPSTSCVPCLGAVEFWAKTSPKPNMAMDVCLTRDDMKMKTASSDVIQPSDSSSDSTKTLEFEDASATAPEQLLDRLTGNLMSKPVRLPCGVFVDKESLERYWATRTNAVSVGGPATTADPFTMLTLDPETLRVDNNLKRNTDCFLRKWRHLNQLSKDIDHASTHVCLSTFVMPPAALSSDDNSSDEGCDNLTQTGRCLQESPIDSPVVKHNTEAEAVVVKRRNKNRIDTLLANFPLLVSPSRPARDRSRSPKA